MNSQPTRPSLPTDSTPTSAPQPDVAQGSSGTARFDDQRRGDVLVVRLPGVHCAQTRIRRALRGLREIPASNGYVAEQLDKIAYDLRIALEAIA